MDTSPKPELSVIVVISSDTTKSRADTVLLEVCLKALSDQAGPPATEIIVPYHAAVDGIEGLRKAFPDVVFVQAFELSSFTGKGGSREHHDELRSVGLAVARGDVIGLLEDQAIPDEHWCARAVEIQNSEFSVVGGAVENGVDSILNWAVYFCDFSRYQNPLPCGESGFASDSNSAYKMSALQSVRHLWADSFHETLVNSALMERGERIALRPDLVAYQNRRGLSLGSAVRERLVWGRSYAATRCLLLGSERFAYALLTPILPMLMAFRLTVNVAKRRRGIRKCLEAFPVILLLLSAWALGEMMGYLTAETD
ncbi:MAG: hypothetical protein J4N34_02545 [Chloroflexi bacterium]|nr:hypothetical protein [Chloroflexota bacterium]MCI0822288.1 hypothetical protein [Chloroflexota bacterium]